jgi:hypothetical protein
MSKKIIFTFLTVFITCSALIASGTLETDRDACYLISSSALKSVKEFKTRLERDYGHSLHDDRFKWSSAPQNQFETLWYKNTPESFKNTLEELVNTRPTEGSVKLHTFINEKLPLGDIFKDVKEFNRLLSEYKSDLEIC